jgi:hypothetical protein
LARLVEVEDDVPTVIGLRLCSRPVTPGELDPDIPLLPFSTRTILAWGVAALSLGVTLCGSDGRSLVDDARRLFRRNACDREYQNAKRNAEPHDDFPLVKTAR